MPRCLSASTLGVRRVPLCYLLFTADGWKQGSGRLWLMKYEKLGACLDYPRPLHLTRHNTAERKGIHHTYLTRNMKIGRPVLISVTPPVCVEVELGDIWSSSGTLALYRSYCAVFTLGIKIIMETLLFLLISTLIVLSCCIYNIQLECDISWFVYIVSHATCGTLYCMESHEMWPRYS